MSRDPPPPARGCRPPCEGGRTEKGASNPPGGGPEPHGHVTVEWCHAPRPIRVEPLSVPGRAAVVLRPSQQQQQQQQRRRRWRRRPRPPPPPPEGNAAAAWGERGAARRGARGRWRALWIGALCAAPTCLRLRPAVVVVAAAATVGVRGEQLLRVEQQEESSSFSPRPENPQWGAGSSPWVSAAWLFPCVYFMCFYFHGELGRADSRRRGWAARLPHRPRRVRDSAARPRLLFPRSSEGSEDLPAAPGPNRRRRAALSWRSGRQLGGSRAGVPSPLMTAPLPNPAAAAKLEGEPRAFLQLLRSTIEKIHNRIKFSQKPSLPTSHGVRGRAAFLLHSARQRKAVRRPLVTVWSFLTTVRSLLKFLLCWRCGVGASSCRCFCSERSYRRTDRQHSPSAQSWCCTSWKATFSSFFLLFVSQQVSDQRFNFILFFLRPRSARMSS